ncbi:hypothetical protein RCL_jg28766.t1 [Rhizophagus clarus]|uniref:Uncharacterized protein n=1 Tax=Rhizophagus clarus TaxID=94130 RepID=A0A8H3QTS0_9GLOM|nr:hypothetical protein RCL_jg28766.t1 [Rhizophagus clarus]
MNQDFKLVSRLIKGSAARERNETNLVINVTGEEWALQKQINKSCHKCNRREMCELQKQRNKSQEISGL